MSTRTDGEADNSIKFLSDMFATRLFHLAAAKLGGPDYRALVDQTLIIEPGLRSGGGLNRPLWRLSA